MVTSLWRLLEMILMIDDDSPAALRRWRTTVAMLMLFFLVHALGAYGLLKFVGIDGFARNVELINVTGRLSDIQDRLLQKSIIDVRIQQCAASSKRYFTDHLRELTDEYWRVNKRGFDVPTCEALN